MRSRPVPPAPDPGRDAVPAAAAAPDAPAAPGPLPPRPGLRSAVDAFRHRNFRLFWIGAVLSNSGTWVQNVTVPFVVYGLTGSAKWLSAAAFAQLVPMALLSPVGGMLADRFDRRRVLIVTQSTLLGVATALWALWVAGAANRWSIIGIVALGGVVTGINVPSWQAFVSELVPRHALLNAVTLNSAQFNAARAVGPAVGGVILGTAGPGAAFAVNAASYVAVLVALAAIRTPPLPKDRSARPRILADTWGTVAYVRAHPGMRTAFLAVMALGVFGQPVAQFVVVFAEDVFGVGGVLYGAMVAALGLGSVLATPLVAGPGSAVSRSRMAAAAMVVYGAGLLAFAVAPLYAVGFLALLVAGGAYLPIAATLNTSLQIQVDEVRRGKVLALYIMVLTLAVPLGSVVQGAAVDAFGPRATVAAAAVGFLVAATVLRLRGLLPHLDDVGAGDLESA
jgi:MFS family permease